MTIFGFDYNQSNAPFLDLLISLTAAPPGVHCVGSRLIGHSVIIGVGQWRGAARYSPRVMLMAVVTAAESIDVLPGLLFGSCTFVCSYRPGQRSLTRLP